MKKILLLLLLTSSSTVFSLTTTPILLPHGLEVTQIGSVKYRVVADAEGIVNIRFFDETSSLDDCKSSLVDILEKLDKSNKYSAVGNGECEINYSQAESINGNVLVNEGEYASGFVEFIEND